MIRKAYDGNITSTAVRSKSPPISFTNSIRTGNNCVSSSFPEYAAEKVRTIYPSAADLRKQWADPALRAEIIAKLEERGIDFDQLRATSNQPEADPFDLLCHLAFNAPLRTRRVEPTSITGPPL